MRIDLVISLDPSLLTFLNGAFTQMGTVLDHIKQNIGQIGTDIAAIKAKLDAAASQSGGISATDAQDLSNQLDGVVTALDALATTSAPTADTPAGETQVGP